jgi:predicted anti-sigma-YlaC factor YlaD
MNNAAGRTTLTKCEEIQSVLFDYLARELGTAQSDLVREHLRRCESCRRSAADLLRTMELLRAADRAARAPAQLSDERRKRLVWAIMHPVLDWIYGHHMLVSIIVALLAIALVLGLLRNKSLWAPAELEGVSVTLVPTGTTATVELNPPASPVDVTALVREAAQQMLETGSSNAPAPIVTPRE